MNQPAEFNVRTTIEALRAVREADVVLSGIKALQGALRLQPRRRSWALLVSFLRASPTCSELATVWDAQSTAKDPRVLPQLLLLVADLISAAPPNDQPQSNHPVQPNAADPNGSTLTYENGSSTAVPEDEKALVASAQEALISLAIRRHLRGLYRCLGAETGTLPAAALSLLAAVAGHGAAAARDLAAAFDWSLTALERVCKPHREHSKGAKDGGKPTGPAAAAAAWANPNPLSRPRRALFVAFVRALLSAADHATLARLLPLRPLMGGLLNHLAADPPGHAFATLAVLGRRLLGGGAAASALPPSLRAQPWGDAALLQLVEVAAASNAPADAAAAAAAAAADADAPAAAPPPAAAAALAAEAALEVLVMLCTDPENGMVPAAAAGSSAEGEVGLVVGQATKRVLRLLPKLRPFERLRHMRLLVEVAERCPGLAAEYGTSMPYDLTPKASEKWVAAVTLATRLVSAAAVAPSALLARLPPPHGTASPSPLQPPPALDSPLVRSHLRCCLPPALSKPVLSRGLQHASHAVQALTLDALAVLLRNAEAALAAAEHGAALAAAAGPPTAAAWAGFHRRLAAAVRSRLPDLQLLLALHAALEKEGRGAQGQGDQDQGQGQQGAGGKAGSKQQQKAAAKKGQEQDGMEVDLDVGTGAVGKGGDEGEEGEEEDEEGGGKAGAAGRRLEEAVLGVAAEGWAEEEQRGGAVRSEVGLRLLRVLAGYCRWLPEAAADAHFEAARLLPQDPLSLPRAHQSAILSVLAAEDLARGGASPLARGGSSPLAAQQAVAAAGAEAAAGAAERSRALAAAAAAAAAPPLSTAVLLPLLRLATRAGSPEVRAAAGDLLLRRVRGLAAFSGGAAAANVTTAREAHPSSSSLLLPLLLPPLALEARVWLWTLPCLPPSQHGAQQGPSAGTAGAVVGHGGGSSNGGAAGPEQASGSSGEAGCGAGGGADGAGGGTVAEAVCAFMADCVVGLSRRPQDGFELLQTWLEPATSPARAVGAVGAAAAAPAPCSALAAVALRNCLKLLRSGQGQGQGQGPEKAQRAGAAAERAAVCGYVSGVLHQLLSAQQHPEAAAAMLRLIEAGLRASVASPPVTAAAAAAAAAAGGKDDAGDSALGNGPHDTAGAEAEEDVEVALPPEGRPLASLLAWARRRVEALSRQYHQQQEEQEGRPTKRARTSSAGGGALVGTPGPRVAGRATGCGGGVVRVVVQTPSAGTATATAKPKRVAKELRALVKAAAAAVAEAQAAAAAAEEEEQRGAEVVDAPKAKKVKSKGMKGQDKDTGGRESDVDAAGLGGKQQQRREGLCKLPPEACDALAAAVPAAVQLLTACSPAEAAEHAVGLLSLAARKAAASAAAAGEPDGGGGKLLAAALWSYVLCRPLAAHCLAATDLDGAAADGGDGEEDGGGGGASPLPSLQAVCHATGAGGGGSAAAVEWDGQMPYALLIAATPPQPLTTDASGTSGAALGAGECTARTNTGGGAAADATAEAPLAAAAFAAAAAAAAATGAAVPGTRPHHDDRVAEDAGNRLEQLARCLLPATARPSGSHGTATCHPQGSTSIVAARGPGGQAAGSITPQQATSGRYPSLSATAVSSAVAVDIDDAAGVACAGLVALLVVGMGQMEQGGEEGRVGAGVEGLGSELMAQVLQLSAPGEALEAAWGLDRAAVVRHVCLLRVGAAVGSMRAALRRQQQQGGHEEQLLQQQKDKGRVGSEGREAGEVLERNLLLLRCAGAVELARLVEELLEGGEACMAGGRGAVTAAAAAAGKGKGKKGKRERERASFGGGEAEVPAAAAAAWRRRAGLQLAAALLSAAAPSGHDSGGPAGGVSPEQLRTHVSRVTVLLQGLVLGSTATGGSAGGGAGAEQEVAAAAALAALAAGLRGPCGRWMAEALAPSAEQLVRVAVPLAAEAPAAAAVAEALLASVVTARAAAGALAAALPAAVAAAEARVPGGGRRLVLARLAPAALSAMKVAAVMGDGDVGVVRAVTEAYREPLLAYVQRKQRKGAAAAAAAALPGDALAALRQHAVPLLLCVLRSTAAAADGGGGNGDANSSSLRALLRAALPRVLPSPGSASAEAVAAAEAEPVATPAEQLAFAAALLRLAHSQQQQQSLGEEFIEAMTAALKSGGGVLAELYGRGVTPSAAASAAAGDTVGDPTRRLLTAALSLVDGAVGDLLADLPDSLRATPAFEAACRAVLPLAAATARHAGTDAAALRLLRRLAASLLPQAAAAGGEGEGAGGAEEKEEEQDEEAGDGEGDTEEGTEVEEEEHGSSGDEDEDMVDGMGLEGVGGSGDDEGGRDGAVASDDEAETEDEEDKEEEGAGADPDEEMEHAEAGSEPGKEEEEEVEQEEEDTGDGDEEAEGDVEGQRQEKEEEDVEAYRALTWGVVPHAGVAAAAGRLLEAVLASEVLPVVFAVAGGGSGGGEQGSGGGAGLGVPAAVARLPLPLVSVLAVGEAVEGTATAGAGVYGRGADAADAVRCEFATLLETLIDMRVAYDTAGGGTEGRFGGTAAERTVLSALLRLLQCAYGGSLRDGDRAVLRVLLRLDELLGGEGVVAGEDGEDEGEEAGAVLLPYTARLLQGPLARSGFLWGAGAQRYYASVPLDDDVSTAPGYDSGGDRDAGHADHGVHGGSGGGAGTGAAAAAAARRRVLSEHWAPEPRALALCCLMYPSGRTLPGEEDDPWAMPAAHTPAATATDGGAAGVTATAAAARAMGVDPGALAAAADPAWVLPFAVCCLRDRTADVHALSGWGVLPLCLRALAARDVRMRTLSYEALAAATAQLDDIAAAMATAPTAGAAAGPAAAGPAAIGSLVSHSAAGAGGGGGGAAAAGGAALGRGQRAAGDFRQRPQLQALLAHVRNGVSAPLQQLPHLAALFAAEAALAVTQPQAPMHKALTRVVGRTPALELRAPALLNRVLASGAPGQRHEQTWALRLLRWGVLDPLDASICRRKFAGEVAMALYGSAAAALAAPAADGTAALAAATVGARRPGRGPADGDGGGAAAELSPGSLAALPLPLAVVCRSLVRLPALARHLVMHAGLLQWLARIVVDEFAPNRPNQHLPTAFNDQPSQPVHGSPPPSPRPLPAAAAAALDTLVDLARRRVCLRRQDGPAALSSYALALQHLAAAAVDGGGGAALAAGVCGLLAAVAAALPPQVQPALWRCLPPRLLVGLREALGPLPAAARGAGGGSSVAEAATAWLQAVVHSSYAVLAVQRLATASTTTTPSGATCRTAGVPAVLPVSAAAFPSATPVLSARSHEAGVSAAARTVLTHSGAVPRLAAAVAITVAELLRCNATSGGGVGGGGRLAAVTLAWLASLTAVGHPLRGSCGQESPAAVTGGREPAAAVVAVAPAVARPALTEELVSELVAAVWVAGASGNGGGGGGGAGVAEQEAGEVDGAVMRLAAWAAEACRAGLVAGAERRGLRGALQGVPSPAVASAWLAVVRALVGVGGVEGGGSGGMAGAGADGAVVERELLRMLGGMEESG